MKSAENKYPILNIAAYLFFQLEDPGAIRAPLREFCEDLELKGTIILSPEGFNLNLAGEPFEIGQFQEYFHQELGLPKVHYKQSWSEKKPFTRMLVKVKKEIVTMGVEGIEPHRFTGKRLLPKEFKKWLDENRDMWVLDTRNEFEINIGRFKKADSLGLKSFREIFQKGRALSSQIKEKPVVMYCTGGIRCEKAPPYF